MKIALVAKPIDIQTGVGRYVTELSKQMEELGHLVILVHPIVPLPKWLIHYLKLLLKINLEAFFNSYPLLAHYPDADIYHISSQNLATLMIFHRPPGRVVITVHDVIPAYSKGNKELSAVYHLIDQLFDAIAMHGLRRADSLIVVSNFTKDTLITHLHLFSGQSLPHTAA